MKFLFIILTSLILTNSSYSQALYSKRWKDKELLTVNDFKMKIDIPQATPCFAQYTISYSLSGFSIFSKNFNQNVENLMMTEASWILDDPDLTPRLLLFQQILFDMNEVFARQLRKELLVNKKQLGSNKAAFVKMIYEQLMKDLSEERSRFIKDSNNGLNVDSMVVWNKDLQKQVQALKVFSYENTDKIKLDKE